MVQKAKTNSNTTTKTLQGNTEIDLNTVQLEKDVGSHFVNRRSSTFLVLGRKLYLECKTFTFRKKKLMLKQAEG